MNSRLALKQKRIENFVIRARRITDGHTLGNEKILKKIIENPNYKEKLEKEENFESLACISRVFLEPDRMEERVVTFQVICNDILECYNILYGHNPSLKKHLKIMKKNWVKTSWRPVVVKDYENYKQTLGWNWVYTDLLHNYDRELDLKDETTYLERYQAGAELVAKITLLILDLLELITELKDELKLDEKAFTTQVRAN